MNIRSSSVLVLLAAFSALALAPLSAAPISPSAIAYPVSSLTAIKGGEDIVRGTYRYDFIRAQRGKAHRELAANVWVYTGYRSDSESANQQGCSILVVTFAQDKVVDMKLVNSAGAAVIATQPTINSNTTLVAWK